MHTGLWWGNLKERDDLSHTWEIIINWILNKWGGVNLSVPI
jgi:hypothetical protein